MKAWQLKHHISDRAMRELTDILYPDVHETTILTSEAAVQQSCRIQASEMHGRLWRNNVGAGKLDNGAFVRWGLANESKAMNDKIKSADLIGIKPVLIKREHVGTIIGQFWSVECKEPKWRFSPIKNKAQADWALLVQSLGGCAEFNNTGVLK